MDMEECQHLVSLKEMLSKYAQKPKQHENKKNKRKQRLITVMCLLLFPVIGYWLIWCKNLSLSSYKMSSTQIQSRMDDIYDDSNLTEMIETAHLIQNEISYGPIHVENNTSITIQFRSSGYGNGLGATILQYYYLRSLCFWNKGNINFQMDRNLIYFDDESLFSYYLPKTPNTNMFSNKECIQRYFAEKSGNKTKYYQMLNEIGNKMLSRIQNENRYALFAPVIAPIFLFVYNGVFLQIVQKEMKFALDTYFDVNNMDLTLFDVAIHFRGGDVLKTAGSGYGVIAYSYFRHIINKIWILQNKKALNIAIITQLPLNWRCDNCSNHTFLKNKHVPSIQQTSMKPYAVFMRNIELKLKQRLSKFGTMRIISNHSLNADFATMVYSKYLICTTSSLCLLAAISRSNENYNRSYLPRKSVWKLYQPNIAAYNTDLLNYLHFNMTPMYQHQFVDNENCTWFKPQVQTSGKTVEDVVQFFLTH